MTLILSKQFLQGEERMHNPPQKCRYPGEVTYTALYPWKQSVIRSAGLCFPGTNTDFVLWNQTKYFVRHLTHQNLLFLLAWMTLLRAEPLGLPFAFFLLLLLPLMWRCCLLGLKLIYALTEEEVYCSAKRKNSKRQSENKGWFLINHNQSLSWVLLETNMSIFLAGHETQA